MSSPILANLPQEIQKEQIMSRCWLTSERGGTKGAVLHHGNCQNARGKVMEIKRLRILEEISWCSAKAAFRKTVFKHHFNVLLKKKNPNFD